MEEGQALVVAPDEAGLRLDAWLARRLPALSRSRLQSLIAAGHVRLDGAPARAAARVRAGQAALVSVPPAAPAVPQPEDIPLRVVHEDKALLVIDKPGIPYWESSWGGKPYRIPDRETGALKRLRAILAKYPGWTYYHQGDPRGAALYLLKPGDVPEGASVDSYYTRWMAVY